MLKQSQLAGFEPALPEGIFFFKNSFLLLCLCTIADRLGLTADQILVQYMDQG